MRKKSLLLFFVLFSTSILCAQNYWKKLELIEQKFALKNKREISNVPSKYDLFSLRLEEFTAKLQESEDVMILLPTHHGELLPFKIKETPVFQEGLAKKFPHIKSFTARSVENSTTTAKISIGTDGVHVSIFSANHSTFYVDPYTKDNSTYIAYSSSDFLSHQKKIECQLDESENKSYLKKQHNAFRTPNDGKLRTYRIAIACTGEYAQFHLTNQNIPNTATDTQKKAAVLSAMNTTMTRVNQIYERDLGVRMVIVNTNDTIIFLDPTTDNLTNSSSSALINEIQSLCDTSIGDANYDIGHVFSTGAGGLAGLGVVCNSGRKAEGVTGTEEPIGDPYDIDFVAHEIGHQFGAEHTFNNSCDDNRSESTTVEPGSGSTIMGYAGICPPNIQNNSNDYFHAVSIQQMWTTIQSEATCATQNNTNNTVPTANAGADVSIPKSTPFVLRGQATDADGTASLTYNWEQIDNGIAVMPPVSTNTGGPLFRSLPSKTTPNRFFPELGTVLAGNSSSTWEVLPAVAREMNFSFTVRDNHSGGGAVARDDIKITVLTVRNSPQIRYNYLKRTIC